MQGVHELADLAPRDVVAKAIIRRMHETGAPHMWLDARHLGAEFWERRFPTILATCRSHGVDPVTELIPVAPACHYASGGVATDLWGRTSVPGLYATRRGAPARACTAPTGWPPTRCSRAWSSPDGSPRRCPASCARGRSPAADDRARRPRDARPCRRSSQAMMTERVGVLRVGRAGSTPRRPARRARRRRAATSRHRRRGRPPTCSPLAIALTEAAAARARRRAARTGARTSPTATTRRWPATSTWCSTTTAGPRARSVRRRRADTSAARCRHDAVRRAAGRPARRARRRGARPARGLRPIVARALDEDLAGGADDTTSAATVPPDARGPPTSPPASPASSPGWASPRSCSTSSRATPSRSPTACPTAPASPPATS